MTPVASQKKKSPFDFDMLNSDFGSILETFSLTAFDFGGIGIPNVPNAAAPPAAPKVSQAPNAPNAAAAPSAASSSARSGRTAAKPAKSAPKSGSKGAKALAVAQQEIGVREQPKGSNRGPRVDQYQNGKGQYWCCHFVSWCFEQNGTSPFGHKGWVEGLRRWAKSNNVYTPSSQATPQAGDVFTMARYDKKGRIVGGHTGFVESYDVKSKILHTVEGNASDSVKQRTRPLNSLDGIIRF